MAAEKAFEEDEDDSARAGKKLFGPFSIEFVHVRQVNATSHVLVVLRKDAKSFLQLDGNDLGGPDPLAFFQLSAHASWQKGQSERSGASWICSSGPEKHRRCAFQGGPWRTVP